MSWREETEVSAQHLARLFARDGHELAADPAAPMSAEELAERPASPCRPSSDISTYISPDDYR